MNGHVFAMTLRRRVRPTLVASGGLVLMIVLVGALFPAIGDSLGNVGKDLGSGAANLIGGGDFSTLAGWLNSEVLTITAPLFVVGLAITGIVGATAAEEEEGSLGLVLSLPIGRVTTMLSKAAAIAVTVTALGLATFGGLIAGVAVAGGGLGADKLAAASLQLIFLGLSFGALAFALGAGTGRRGLATSVAAGAAVVSFLVNGLAPTVASIEWLKYLSPFYYYNGNDPLSNGLDLAQVAVLAGLTIVLVVIGLLGVRRRDLRG